MKCNWSLDEIVAATSGRVLSSPVAECNGVATDTRQDMKGQVFVALKGPSHDAHLFLSEAVVQGASILVVHEESPELESLKETVSVILVDDTLKALQDMASAWRKKISAKVIAITGSNGKTTTKEFAAKILETKFKTVKSPASFNNHWGVPISLLGVGLDQEVAVLEMGMNHSGEIKRLCEIVSPDVVVVTVVGRSHIGELGSLEAVVKAKEEIYENSPKAVQIFNLDNEHCAAMFDRASQELHPVPKQTFSSYRDTATVKMRVSKMDLHSIEVTGRIGDVEGAAEVQIFGRQNVVNIMAAATLCLSVGMEAADIWAALPKLEAAWGRNQLMKLESGTQVLFDAYNANPESMAALVKNLFEIAAPREKVMILGEMLELGDQTDALHEELGEMVGNTDIDTLWFVGPSHKAFEAGLKRSAFQKNYYLSSTYELDVAKKIASVLHQQDIVVIKGSRGVHLEQVLKDWEPENFK